MSGILDRTPKGSSGSCCRYEYCTRIYNSIRVVRSYDIFFTKIHCYYEDKIIFFNSLKILV
jgi:hypothetical protein